MVKITDVLAYIKSTHVISNKDATIKDFKSLSSAGAGDVTFCSAIGQKGLGLIKSSKASLIICHSSLENEVKNSKATLIFVNNPKLWFVRCMRQFASRPALKGIDSTAIIRTKKIGKKVYVGAFTFIDENVIIGDHVIIHGGVHILGNATIGNNVTIDSSTVIGHDGFGYVKDEKGEWILFPHTGGVRIEDEVEIGTNVCIDRGTLEDTIVGQNTKIDNLVHIAHNVKVGRNCIIVAQSCLGGSCILEDGVFIGAGAIIRDGGIRLSKNAFIGMGAVVTKDVPANTTVAGVPAKPIKKNHDG